MTNKFKLIVLISFIFFLGTQISYCGDFQQPADNINFDDLNPSFGPENTMGQSIFTNEAKSIGKSSKKRGFFKAFGKRSKKNNNAKDIKPVVIDYDYDTEKEEIIPIVNEVVSEEPTVIDTTEQKKKSEKVNNKKQKKAAYSSLNSDVIIYCDNMDYLQDKQEIVGTGNAKVVFTANNSMMTSDKIVYNHDLNYIEGLGNVKISRNGAVVDGDYTKLDLNFGNAMVDNPVIDDYQIKIVAKKGNVTTDTIEAYDGTMTTTSDISRPVYSSVHATTFPLDVNYNMYKKFYPKESRKKGSKYHIKTNIIYVNSTEGHDIITFKHADVYAGKVLLMKGSDLTLSTDKSQAFVETTLPEIGSMRYVGAYAGPGFVINVPKSSTLKLAPILTLDDNKLGLGIFARYRNKRNLTTVIYSTAANQLVARGRQQLGDSDFFVEYARKAYMNDWFIGSNISEYLAQLVYEKRYNFTDYDMQFMHRATAGYLTDEFNRKGTARFRYQAMLYKSLLQYYNYDKKMFADIGFTTQGMMGLYGTGDTTGLFRIGPTLRTQYRGWGQNITYFQSAVAGKSPLKYTDDYRYGKSTLHITESLRLNKYISLGFLTTINLTKDDPLAKNMFSESRVMISFGPDDAKLSFGYDMIRQGTMLNYSALIGTKNQDIKFKKLFMKNPDKLGQQEEKKKKKRKPFTVYPTPVEKSSKDIEEKEEKNGMEEAAQEVKGVMESPGIFNFTAF